MITGIIKDEEGKEIAMLPMPPKTFSTGSRGYHGTGKVYIAGKKYQGNLMLVEVGSKPAKA